jgi:EpsI family protein
MRRPLTFESSGPARLWLTAGLLLSASLLLNAVNHRDEAVVPRQPLQELTYTLGAWRGEERPLQKQTVQAVGVTDYTNRLYSTQDAPLIQLFIGYYSSQRTGDTVHSPKNCLPGAGWDPIYAGYATISLPDGRQIVVNEYVIQQDQNKQLVFYWYQGRSRVIASEYWGKFWMVADAISRNRTDSALIRVNTSMNDGETKARSRLVSFTRLLFPHLRESIPN